MVDIEANIPKELVPSLNASGFPFQTAIRHEIASTKGCKIYASEYPWKTHDNGQHFLDLIAVCRRVALTVECKKTDKEIYTFLLPLGPDRSTGAIEEFRWLRVLKMFEELRQLRVVCETWNVWPPSPVSEFCIVSTSKSGKDQRLLERDASLLVTATDAFAKDVDDFEAHRILELPYFVMPVIVTNAKIYTARYAPSEISLEKGQFSQAPDDITEVPWVRFAKPLIAGHGRDFGYRSVFVVNPAKLREFLQNLELVPESKQPKD